MSVPEPPLSAGVLTGPPAGLGAGERTPGRCCRRGGRRGGVPGVRVAREGALLAAAALAARKWAPRWPAPCGMGETRSAGGSGVFGVELEAVDGEVILRFRDSSSLLALCYTLVVEDELVKMIAL